VKMDLSGKKVKTHVAQIIKMQKYQPTPLRTYCVKSVVYFSCPYQALTIYTTCSCDSHCHQWPCGGQSTATVITYSSGTSL
jgi:hypothetical protein